MAWVASIVGSVHTSGPFNASFDTPLPLDLAAVGKRAG